MADLHIGDRVEVIPLKITAVVVDGPFPNGTNLPKMYHLSDDPRSLPIINETGQGVWIVRQTGFWNWLLDKRMTATHDVLRKQP